MSAWTYLTKDSHKEFAMKRSYLIVAVIFVLTALMFAYSQTSRRTTQTPQTRVTAQPITIEAVVSTQQRINRYFHGDVMSKLTKCWSTVRGKGTIAFKYTYTKTNGRWLFNRLATEGSTLPKGEDSLAQKCMLNAVGGTSFPIAAPEGTENTYVLNWTWPVPLPVNGNQLTAAMFAARPSQTNEVGCDGWGTPAKCYTCGEKGCIKVCVGHQECTVYGDNSDVGLSCLAKDNCASGGPFSVSGMAIMY
jgi:hypothetical protein